MTVEEIYREHLDEVTQLYKSAINDLNETYESKKDEHSATPGLLKDILVGRSLRNEFTKKYPPSNIVLENSNGNIINISPELDKLIHRMYLDLLNLPETLINQL